MTVSCFAEAPAAGPLSRPFRPGDVGRHAAMMRARGFAWNLAPVLREIRAEGITTPSGIASAMTLRGVRKPRGGTVWTVGAVQKLMRMLDGGADR